MRGHRPSWALFLSSAALLGAVPAAADPPAVDLAAHVPASWLDDSSDALPLRAERWRGRLPARCQTRGGYRRYCQGARRVPTPRGLPAQLARRLGLGQRATALLLMHGRPLAEWLEAVAEEDADPSLTFPVLEGRLGRGFGRTRTGSLRHRRHHGVDIAAPEGAPIVAARGGLVVYSDDELTGFGNVVMLLHRGGFSTMYAHCRATHVFAGQRVRRGQRIAEVGATGLAPAPHLHFEWRQRGWARDPAPLFRRR